MKQIWRLAQDKSSLAFNILKSKYFSWCNFFKPELRRNSSLIWRSIWEVKNNLMEGLAWRIGDGKKTRVWLDI